ncbi:hypothetical protein [Lysobacter capsici]|uniref:hypothetical protein n=1 Tax=Lysobacter capsici TaxID=435897 RepID=UPI0012FDF0EF|nr:hypothetical protein [Lysobacter capsici]
MELDTTGVSREDLVIQVVCELVDWADGGWLQAVESYRGLRSVDRSSTPEALAVHGLSEDVLLGNKLELALLHNLVERAACLVSRHPRFTAKKLHSLVPACLGKRWYEYPAHIQGYPGATFPATERMSVMAGRAESFGYGRRHQLSELLDIDGEQHVLVFDEEGPPEVSVRFGRRKVLGGFAEALLKCEVGTRFRLHGKEGYDFITGYCNDGPAYRERAFRLATTPSNLELVSDRHLDIYLKQIEGMTYHLALK